VHSEGAAAEAWKEVLDFGTRPQRIVTFTLDSTTGELRFGPAVRAAGRQSPAVWRGSAPRSEPSPSRLVQIRGGQAGNVRAGFLNTLKTAIPYIARVENRQAAEGGLDAETVEAAVAAHAGAVAGARARRHRVGLRVPRQRGFALARKGQMPAVPSLGHREGDTGSGLCSGDSSSGQSGAPAAGCGAAPEGRPDGQACRLPGRAPPPDDSHGCAIPELHGVAVKVRLRAIRVRIAPPWRRRC